MVIRTENIKWLVLTSAIVINLCLGAINAWSIFATQLRIENPEWTISQIATVFSIMLFAFAMTTIISGWVQDKIGPKWVATTGGILLGIGIIMSGRATSLIELYIWHGVIAGMGIGSAYVTPLATVLKWFPDKRGLMSGIVMGFFGAGAFLFGPLASYLITLTGSINDTFIILGIIYLIAVVGGAQFLITPDSNRDNNINIIKNQKNLTPLEMLAHKNFYVIWLVYVMGCSAGLALLSNAQEVAQLFAGLTSMQAVSIVSIIAIFNALGSPFFGTLSDYIGRKYSLTSLCILAALAFLLLPLANTFVTFLLVSSVIMLCFGGLFGVFPTISADFYGTKHLGINYGLLFLAYGFAAFIGPSIASTLADVARENALLMGATPNEVKIAVTEGYTRAFYYVSGMLVIGAFLTLFINSPNYKEEYYNK
ncbi:hypothetical protein SYNTR_1010 [Candidatus Syntrophocurvum alkaliphilum]|uniref:Major facilitator superfamily (MFS) profile domain-containing protein n=1 Tax=Candidatus Syntrophocurvum alkaliphilum TaxID=2293317 RepID=A0A6I6DH23_9FIRM|nr:OFA family MFS transporter [Candidatus Syntrophocurvum alkaliphilum]QGT99603.1 hypothetical protein SYNTR_1010 [Candidatus Syntrophocurvum alkaliphilum]